MRILHYALGFPPYRTGGLTKYCTDLMITQREDGHEVGLLWPGKIGFVLKETKIKENKNWNGILNFEIINPLPVALDEGILDIDAYVNKTEAAVFEKFLNNFKPDVIHIHTLMGLHAEFIDVAKKMGIKTTFTSHDYYGLCPKVTLFRENKICDDDHGCIDCVRCNQNALSLKKIALMQSPLYRLLKNTAVVKKLRKKHRNNFFENDVQDKNEIQSNDLERAREYEKLRKYYVSMLEKIDKIHFNSTVAEKVYGRFFEPKSSQVLSITHRDIKDHRKVKDFDHQNLRLTYLGPAKAFKGFYYLLEVLDDLWEQGVRSFELHIYTATNEQRPYISHQQEGYPYSQLEDIFDNTDMLVVPSLWYETFGFTVLEALSYGVPVLVSDNVGAKDIIQHGKTGFVFREYLDAVQLIKLLVKDKEILCQINSEILNDNSFFGNIIRLYGGI